MSMKTLEERLIGMYGNEVAAETLREIEEFGEKLLDEKLVEILIFHEKLKKIPIQTFEDCLGESEDREDDFFIKMFLEYFMEKKFPEVLKKY